MDLKLHDFFTVMTKGKFYTHEIKYQKDISNLKTATSHA